MEKRGRRAGQNLLKKGIAIELSLLVLLLFFRGFDIPRKISSFFDGSAAEVFDGDGGYIKWVDFDVTSEALQSAYQCDVDSYGSEQHLDWVALLAYLGVRYGGDFKKFRASDMEQAAEAVREQGIETLCREMKYYQYYYEAYAAVLGGMVGEYELEEAKGASESETAPDGGGISESGTASDDGGMFVKKYGLKAFSPIAKGFPYSGYDDFGVSRSFGYKRQHLGHDMMGQVGTPIIAVESGYVAALGWNRYGGWRIGINSFDGKRYYYYAHLRQDRPYAEGLKEGDVVTAGDVIGYMGRTGYSDKENVNNISVYHLHFGIQLIFDESQREGNNEIWIDPYALTQFLHQNQSEAVRDDETKEWRRTYRMRDPAVTNYLGGTAGQAL